MTPDSVIKIVASICTLIVSAFQAYGNLLKRSVWIGQAESAVGSFGGPFRIVDKLPLQLSAAALFSVVLLSLGALWGGIEALSSASDHKEGGGGEAQTVTHPEAPAGSGLGALVGGVQAVPQPPQDAGGQTTTPSTLSAFWAWLFQHSLHFFFAYLLLGVLIYFNVIPKVFLAVSQLLAMRDRELLYHPGLINAAWHIRREENGVPINTNADNCRYVADTYVTKAAIERLNYDQHRAEKPSGLSADELANVLLIANLIEHGLHSNRLSHKFAFGVLYQRLGAKAADADRLFSPELLIESNAKRRSFYASLRASIPDLPDVASIDATVQECVKILALGYSGRASELARPKGGGEYDVQVLLDRLERLPGFRNSRPMRTQVVKLGIEWGVWPGIRPGPFAYPFNLSMARLLLNLSCLCTKPDVKSIACDDEFQRLHAWTLDRIVDEVERLLRSSTDDRISTFCQTRFGAQPSDVERWKLCRDLDYFLWVQSRQKEPAGGVFGDQGTAPWKVDGDNLVKG